LYTATGGWDGLIIVLSAELTLFRSSGATRRDAARAKCRIQTEQRRIRIPRANSLLLNVLSFGLSTQQHSANFHEPSDCRFSKRIPLVLGTATGVAFADIL